MNARDMNILYAVARGLPPHRLDPQTPPPTPPRVQTPTQPERVTPPVISPRAPPRVRSVKKLLCLQNDAASRFYLDTPVGLALQSKHDVTLMSIDTVHNRNWYTQVESNISIIFLDCGTAIAQLPHDRRWNVFDNLVSGTSALYNNNPQANFLFVMCYSPSETASAYENHVLLAIPFMQYLGYRTYGYYMDPLFITKAAAGTETKYYITFCHETRRETILSRFQSAPFISAFTDKTSWDIDSVKSYFNNESERTRVWTPKKSEYRPDELNALLLGDILDYDGLFL